MSHFPNPDLTLEVAYDETKGGYDYYVTIGNETVVQNLLPQHLEAAHIAAQALAGTIEKMEKHVLHKFVAQAAALRKARREQNTVTLEPLVEATEAN